MAPILVRWFGEHYRLHWLDSISVVRQRWSQLNTIRCNLLHFWPSILHLSFFNLFCEIKEENNTMPATENTKQGYIIDAKRGNSRENSSWFVSHLIGQVNGASFNYFPNSIENRSILRFDTIGRSVCGIQGTPPQLMLTLVVIWSRGVLLLTSCSLIVYVVVAFMEWTLGEILGLNLVRFSF